jgi:Ca-activated chloride channel family protein
MNWLIPILAVLVAAVGEWLHWRRVRRLGRLAFGPSGRPALWTVLTPFLRIFCLAGIGWALIILFSIHPKTFDQGLVPAPVKECRRVVFLVDVSPSMLLADAGEDGKMKRRYRGAQVIESIMERVVSDQCLFSVIAFYTGAQTVAIDCRDTEIVKHIVTDLPLDCAFDYGKTNLAEGIIQTFKTCKDWPEASTTVFVITDGDTVPDKGLQNPPRSIARTVIVGVGNAANGIFIDGHQSRQDTRSLAQVARRISGDYFNGNAHHLPTAMMNDLDRTKTKGWLAGAGLREIALLTLAVSTLLLALIPALLDQFGSNWLGQRAKRS